MDVKFDKILRRIIPDVRYKVLKKKGFKKAAFHEYCQQKAKKIRVRARTVIPVLCGVVVVAEELRCQPHLCLLSLADTNHHS